MEVCVERTIVQLRGVDGNAEDACERASDLQAAFDGAAAVRRACSRHSYGSALNGHFDNMNEIIAVNRREIEVERSMSCSRSCEVPARRLFISIMRHHLSYHRCKNMIATY